VYYSIHILSMFSEKLHQLQSIHAISYWLLTYIVLTDTTLKRAWHLFAAYRLQFELLQQIKFEQ